MYFINYFFPKYSSSLIRPFFSSFFQLTKFKLSLLNVFSVECGYILSGGGLTFRDWSFLLSGSLFMAMSSQSFGQ